MESARTGVAAPPFVVRSDRRPMAVSDVGRTGALAGSQVSKKTLEFLGASTRSAFALPVAEHCQQCVACVRFERVLTEPTRRADGEPHLLQVIFTTRPSGQVCLKALALPGRQCALQIISHQLH